MDGEASSFTVYREKVILRTQISPAEPGERAANAFLRATVISPKVRVDSGKDHFANDDGVRHFLRILRERCVPDATDAIGQGGAMFMRFRLAGQTTDVYVMEFDVLREKAEARMATGGGFPDEFVSIGCAQNAPAPEREKSLAVASFGSTLACPAMANHMRRLFGPRGSAARQDVLSAAEFDTDSGATRRRMGSISGRQRRRMGSISQSTKREATRERK